MIKVFYILLFILPFYCLAQVKDIGTPYIQNYPKSVYEAGTQNWDITQDANKFMYFANNDGVLRFDGLNWNITHASQSSPVRTVFADGHNNIYVGLINDFGILSFNEPEMPVFKSLKHFLPAGVDDFDDIWRIHEMQDGIIFQCYKYLFWYKNDKIEVIKPQRNFHFSFKLDNRFFVHEPGLGVFEFNNGDLTKLPYWENHKDKNISAILAAKNNEILICTEGSGIYKFVNEKIEKWNTPVNDFIEKNKLYCATTIPGNYFAFGTILNGLVIADSKGNIVQTLNTTNGIQNNTILSLFADRDGNLWLGLDNGIDYVEINSPVNYIGNFTDLGTGYCCKVFNENLYLGTNQGLFVRPFNNRQKNQAFELVQNTAGQVWSLDVFDGQLICGHNLGTFSVEGKEAVKISNEEGAWKYIRLNNHPDYLIGGHYNGLVLLKKEKKGWKFHCKVKGFSESSRFLCQGANEMIWVSHGSKGIFQIELDPGLDSIVTAKLYNSNSGLLSNFGNVVHKLNDEIFVSAGNGFYQFNPDSNVFHLSEKFNKLFDMDGRLKTVDKDESDNIWYIADSESGVLRLNEDLTYTKIISPFKKLQNKYVNEFEFIYPFNNDNIFIGIEDGFAHYSSKFSKSYSKPFQSFITKIELPYIDSTLYFNSAKSKTEFQFPFRKNTFRFHFAAPFFENDTPLEFSYFLEDFSEHWSEWSTDSYKDFSNLWEGTYLFKVKAKNIYDVESETATFQFTISPPWNRSNLAYSCYVIFFLLLSVIIIRFILYRMKLSKRREELRYQQELQKKEEKFQHEAVIAEKEIIKLRNEKLRSEMIHRDKELANQTMGIIQKNRFLKRINEELQHIQNLSSGNSAENKILGLKKRINKEIDNKHQNQIFETYFDEVHQEFFERLKEKYPILTLNDLRLCAFIKMNISTKEIATILNISYRGAEISRYRLRKKLELSRDINLSTFLSNI